MRSKNGVTTFERDVVDDTPESHQTELKRADASGEHTSGALVLRIILEATDGSNEKGKEFRAGRRIPDLDTSGRVGIVDRRNVVQEEVLNTLCYTERDNGAIQNLGSVREVVRVGRHNTEKRFNVKNVVDAQDRPFAPVPSIETTEGFMSAVVPVASLATSEKR